MAQVSRFQFLARSRPLAVVNRTTSTTKVRRFSEAVSNPSNRVQVYVSRSRDPYLNLSIEHFLLQKSAPESVVLFLYTNRPCVVIGRNQNPWLEVNLGLIGRPGLLARVPSSGSGRDDENGGVSLVRRRSGGGTVFHDEGNVNYSVICPPATFDRDKHTEMVVRALRSLGATTTRVNERHDIVLDVSDDTTSAQETETKTFKISGSAYKLTRLRSLHHGTCLLSTPNLDRISQFLHSPAEPFIKARGVESVRSRIRNVGLDNLAFEEAVVAEFGAMYGDVGAEVISEDDVKGVPEVIKGYDELKSLDWIYTQTPRFTFSTHPTEDDPRQRPALPDYLPKNFEMSLTAYHGKVTDARVTGVVALALESCSLHQIHDWRPLVGDAAGAWFNGMFGARTS